MAEGIRLKDDEITPYLRSVFKKMDNKQPLQEAGEKMVTLVKEAHRAGLEFATGRKMKPLSPKYKKRKQKQQGSSMILFGIPPSAGRLFRSWRVLRVTKTNVVVGAGTEREEILASAHDGGLAQKLGDPKLNRLRLEWKHDKLKKVAGEIVEKLFSP